jgi:hypothetical protein
MERLDPCVTFPLCPSAFMTNWIEFTDSGEVRGEIGRQKVDWEVHLSVGEDAAEPRLAFRTRSAGGESRVCGIESSGNVGWIIPQYIQPYVLGGRRMVNDSVGDIFASPVITHFTPASTRSGLMRVR